MKSVTNRYRPNYRQARASQPVLIKPAVTRRDTGTSQFTQASIPKPAPDAKATQTPDTILSDTVQADALPSIKPTATPSFKSSENRNDYRCPIKGQGHPGQTVSTAQDIGVPASAKPGLDQPDGGGGRVLLCREAQLCPRVRGTELAGCQGANQAPS